MYEEITGQRPTVFDQGVWNGGYLPWGKDNRYPNRLNWLIEESFTAKSCYRKLVSFMEGSGFRDSEQFVGKHKLGRIWERSCKSGGANQTFAVHVNYNLQYKISEINYIPVSNCRYKIPKEGWEIKEIGLSDCWGKNGFLAQSNVVDLDIYNPDPNVVREQIQRDGIQNYKGQVYIYTEYGEEKYPLSLFHPARESIETEVEVKLFSNSNVRNAYKPSQVFVRVGAYDSPEEKEAFQKGIKENVGGQNANKVNLLSVNSKEQIPVVLPLRNINYDKEHEATRENAKEDIRNACYGIQPILLGWKGQNQLAANVNELKQAAEFFSAEVKPTQDRFKIAINEILDNSIFSARIDDIEPFKIVDYDTVSNGTNDNPNPKQPERKEDAGGGTTS